MLLTDTNRIHMPVKNISVEFVDSYDSVPGNISAEISFDPTEGEFSIVDSKITYFDIDLSSKPL